MTGLLQAILEESKRIKTAQGLSSFEAFQVAKRKLLVDMTEKASSIDELKTIIIAMLTINGPQG